MRAGQTLRAVARAFRVGLRTVQRWVSRAREHELDQVDWTDRVSMPHTIQRTSRAIEDLVLRVRQELRETSALGEYGDRAIYEMLRARGLDALPVVRTIARILVRRGALDGRRRIRRPPPPPGWYLPDVAERRAELDSVDAIEDLVIEGGTHVDVLTSVSLHGGLPGAWPGPTLTTNRTLEALLEHWRMVGLPGYVQFDNDPRFTGGNRYADVLGRVVRLCLSLEVTPVFVPPRETGFQAAVESLNARWQAKVWHRFHHDTLSALCERSARYVTAYRQRLASRIDAAPARRRFPQRWRLDQTDPLRGRIVYLRRTDATGKVQVLGQPFAISAVWPHRLVRCEVALATGRVSFYALRRRDPSSQRLLRAARCHWRLRDAQG